MSETLEPTPPSSPPLLPSREKKSQFSLLARCGRGVGGEGHIACDNETTLLKVPLFKGI